MFKTAPLAWITLLLAGAAAQPPTTKPAAPGEFITLMNVGSAHLENRNSAGAIEAFEEAVKRQPTSAPAQRNLARSFLLARRFESAADSLAAARLLDPESAATSYLEGLTFTRLTQFDLAVERFERAVRLDPDTAALRYQLALAYQAAGQADQATAQLHETVRLDPLHGAAHFRLATHAKRTGDADGFERHFQEFQRLKSLFDDSTRSADALERCRYTQPEPPVPPRRSADQEPAARTIEVHFTDATQEAFSHEVDRAATALAVLEVNHKGASTLLLVHPEGALALLEMSAAGTFTRTLVAGRPSGVAEVRRCIVGDFHDEVPQGVPYDPQVHARGDVLLLGQGRGWLLRRAADGGFQDVTDEAGLGALRASDGRWVDYEHDGDLDLLAAGDEGLQLWQNNGDATFTNVTHAVGIRDTGPVTGVHAADLDADVAVDLVAVGSPLGSIVYENQKAGRFAAKTEPPGPWPPARQVLLDDINNDGIVDAILIGGAQAIVLLARAEGRTTIDLSGVAPRRAGLVDYDSDGWLDLCVAGAGSGDHDRGAIRLWRNLGAGGWSDVTAETKLDAAATPPIIDLVAADVDGDADSDFLVLASDDRLRWLRNDGGHRNGQLKIVPATTKTNPSGLGTHVELRAGDFWVTRSVTGLPIEIGVGGHRRLDVVQTVWTTGVVENQIGVEVTGSPLVIVEKNVATGSCPFLYAWDGYGYRFVTDLLGNSPIGLPLRRGQMLPADPEEIVLVGNTENFVPREGSYALEITSEFCEVLYLDAVRLIAVDHPPGVEVHSTDKLMPEPFPASELWALKNLRLPIRAVGDDGVDRTGALLEIDGVFTPPGALLPAPFRGMCHPLALTLDFGEIPATGQVVMALTGWLAYGQASTNIALSQSRAHRIVPPALEVQRRSNEWQPVDVTVGMPAGKTKTILCDLSGKLPADARRLRLTTSFEIRWDRIALFDRDSEGGLQFNEIAPAQAGLWWRGFSELRSRAPGHPTTPDYNVVADRPPWRTVLEGWCTRYGDALELVDERDGRVAIINAGDALTLRFAADRLPPLPQGTIRSFFLYSAGWEKDCDHNVEGGDAVEPLPPGGDACDPGKTGPDGDWRFRYNTRWVPRDHFAPETTAPEPREEPSRNERSVSMLLSRLRCDST